VKALRRIAALVTENAAASEVFDAVVEAAAEVLSVPVVALARSEPDASLTILAARGPSLSPGSEWPLRAADDPARVPDSIASAMRSSGVLPLVSAPVIVGGVRWGLLVAGAPAGERLPRDAEDRLNEFTELAAIAVSSIESADRLRRLLEGQGALRRVAKLVAEGASVTELFAAISQEIVAALGVRAIAIDRYEHDGSSTTVGALNTDRLQVGSRSTPDARSLRTTVLETGRPARIDYGEVAGAAAEGPRAARFRSAFAAPIIVDGLVWGMLWVGTDDAKPLPEGSETQLLEFAELVAVAVSNASSRDRLRRLADQEASLRRVATLVAEGASPRELFAAVAEEVARILDVLSVSLVRYEPDGGSIVLASFNDPHFQVDSRWPRDDRSLNAIVRETGRAARIDDFSELPGRVAAAARASGVHSGIAAPIVVEGGVWGMIAVGRRELTEPAESIEARLSAFTGLVGIAVANAQAREERRGVADEQAALRRVATLVARGAPPLEVFAAVAEEAGRLFVARRAYVTRYEGGKEATLVAGWSSTEGELPVGLRFEVGEGGAADRVRRTARPSRVDAYVPGSDAAQVAQVMGIETAVGAPISVEGRLWGLVLLGSALDAPLPPETEERLGGFTELLGTAIANAQSKSELAASRRRIVAASDEARRRIERNLHDGTQQRLLALGLDAQAVRAMIPERAQAARGGVDRIVEEIEAILEEVRELSRGLHPALLTRGGLGPSIRMLARRSPIPVEVRVDMDERPPAPIETAVYYVVSEAVTNAIKHSHASTISVGISADGLSLRASIADDGIGGAASNDGSGLVGLADRVEALGGRFGIESPDGGGTRISVALPLASPPPSWTSAGRGAAGQ
jgi:signal transduction histidine kinase